MTVDPNASTRSRAQVQRGPGKPMTSAPIRVFCDESKKIPFLCFLLAVVILTGGLGQLLNESVIFCLM